MDKRNTKTVTDKRKKANYSNARIEYSQAYHRIRTLHSLELYRERDHYPVGFDCPDYGHCETIHTPCHCWFEYCKEERAQREVLEEAKALLESLPQPVKLVIAATKAYVAKLEFNDYWGNPMNRPINPTLTRKLQAKTKRGHSLRSWGGR